MKATKASKTNNLTSFALLICISQFALGCDHTQETGAENAEIKSHVMALETEHFGAFDLGTPSEVYTTNVQFLVAQGDAAVPLLVASLGELKKPTKVGYVALCLRELRSSEGRQMATKAYAKLSAKDLSMSQEERSVVSQLYQYLEVIKQIEATQEIDSVRLTSELL